MMQIASVPLEDRFVRLEPFEDGLKTQVQAALDCDPEAWGIMVAPAYGDHFDAWWKAALAAMQAQPEAVDGWRGRIAVVASVAAFVPAPGAPAYCASKAAVDAWTVGTAAMARRQGVLMTSVCPGYVRTAMTARNRFPMPGLMGAERAAGIILRGLSRGARRIVFPWWMGLAARLVGLLPLALSTRLLNTVPGKDGL